MSTLYVDNLAPNLGSQVEIPDLKPLAGSVVRAGSAKHSNYAANSTVNTWLETYTFTVTGITQGNTLQMTYSVNDLVQDSNSVYFRVRSVTDNNNVLVEWGRATHGNGQWRGIISDAAFEDTSTSGGTRTYAIDFYTTYGAVYVNYPSGDTDCASFLTWQEIAQ